MNVNDEHKAITTALDAYRSWLDEIPEDQFAETPANGGWSYAEVYSHILQASLGSSVAAEKCCRKTGVTTNKGLNLKGMLVFLLGSFPPGKRQAPPAVAALTKKIDKEEARNLIVRLRKRIEELAVLMHNGVNKDNKISHPGLGMLNGPQWFKFLRIHLQHHLKQLSRIKKSFPQK
jgi:hypothetical protein